MPIIINNSTPNIVKGLLCPTCESKSRVIDTAVSINVVTRVRLCRSLDCHRKFKSVEDRMSHEKIATAADTHRKGLPCPECGGNTSVSQTRRAVDQVRRRRRCLDCNHTFKTKERLQR